MKICSVCGKQPTDPLLIQCPDCKAPFIHRQMLALFLSAEDKKQIAKMLVWSWQFWVPFMIDFLAACLFIWKGIGSVAKSQATKMFNEEMTNRIKLEFQEPRIREILVDLKPMLGE